MPSRAVEDYLKQILLLSSGPDEPARVPMGRLAESLAVAPGTATAMVKRLAANGMLDYEPYAGVLLSPAGRDAAIAVLRRHRLIETFLVEALGLDWTEVHEEAERLEHALSDKLLDRIDAFLGHPAADPHGDPIPDVDGGVRQAKLESLTHCADGDVVRVARITDQDAAFLRFADRHDLRPGLSLTVRGRSEEGDSLTLQTQTGETITLGSAAADKVLVEHDAVGARQM